jgi:hypothetical protein
MEFLSHKKPTHGPYTSIAKLQNAFGLVEKSFINRADFHKVFAQKKRSGLTISLFELGKSDVTTQLGKVDVGQADSEEVLYDVAGGGTAVGDGCTIYDMAN